MHELNLIGVVIYKLMTIAAIIHVLMDNRQPAKTVAWVLVIYFVPVVGILFYLFIGINTRRKRLVSQRSMDQLTKRSMLEFVEQQNFNPPPEYATIIQLFTNQNMALPFQNNRTTFYTTGSDFFLELLQAIGKAQHHIHINMYIFDADPIGRLIADALIDKARQGVEVRVIYDDVGCWNVPNPFFEHMREAGIEVSAFLPVRFPLFTSKANYRNHRKLIVIDGHTGFIGGMNIALRYVKGTQLGLWRDTMVKVEGGAVYGLQRAFLVDWYFVDRTPISKHLYYPTVSPTLSNQCLAQVVTSSPATLYPEIMQGLVHIILNARRYLYIQTPYFLPTDSVLIALKTAAVSGIDVRLMVPLHNDGHLVEWASRSYLREVAEAGIKVLFYADGFLHSKLIVSDDWLSSCGSTNIDCRSFENNFEANIFFYDTDTAITCKRLFLDDEKHCQTMESWMNQGNAFPGKLPFLQRLLESILRLMAPIL